NDIIVDSDETTDFLNGGTGQDSITPGTGDHVDTGPGADTLFLGQWLESPVTVHGFDAGEDLLVVFYQGTTPPELQLEPADGRLVLLANGAEMASFAADSALDLQQVALLRAP
ncbi:MAG: calcium-binding protein, partial [Rhodobacteraceae bacterium]|nr:calcium-binding protein [Paracoccaceae bacterium]